MKFEIPSNLKVKRIVFDADERSNDIAIDKLHYVCHIINRLMLRLDDDMRYNGSDYKYGVPLNSRALRKALGRRYRDTIDVLIEHGIIETNDVFEVGKTSKQYRFTEQYRYSSTKYVAPKTNKYREFSIPQGAVKIDASTFYDVRLVKRVQKMFVGLTIDVIAANSWVDKYYEEQRQVIISAKNKKAIQRKLKELVIKCNGYRESIRKVHVKEASFVQDAFGHRLHTPLTRLKKELRQFVRYDGMPLVEIDIANSQLFFMIPLLQWKMYHPQAGGGEKNTFKHRIWIGEDQRETYRNTIMWCKEVEMQYSKGLQEISFVSDACKGIVYERVAQYLSASGYFKNEEAKEEKRAHVKKYLLKLIFASPTKNYSMYNASIGAIWDAFKACYPEIGKLVILIKGVDYKAISRLLQRIESYCIIGSVCKIVNDKNADIPLFTLHDCIVTTDNYVETVEKELLGIITELIGFTPTVKRKVWNVKKTQFTMLKNYIDRISNLIRKRAA
ncbi:MAG: hypothetical protein H6551_12090 [Chitinophagales bacterium]|nr:hypothetical protein [Chitinophagaceae bacterium]MCB9065869.1 hypothetical protein [Chitinophagales bacterium]